MEDIMKKCMVVYLITNTVNGKKYVGQTQRVLGERIKEHKDDKKRPIGKAIHNYKWENFTVEILDECRTPDELNVREMYWIATLNTKAPNGYNLTDGGVGTAGHTYTVEARQNAVKRELTSEQRRHMSEAAPNRCVVLCVETGKVFPSFAAAAAWACISFNGIAVAAKDETRTAGGYHWRAVSEPSKQSSLQMFSAAH